MGSVADIPFNKYLGITFDEDARSLALPDGEPVRNYFGSVSFCAQFALAESASAQYLFDRLGMELARDMPTLRTASVKFSRPTEGESTARLVSLQHTAGEFQRILDSKGKIVTSVTVAVLSDSGVKALEGEFTWLILRKKGEPAA